MTEAGRHPLHVRDATFAYDRRVISEQLHVE